MAEKRHHSDQMMLPSLALVSHNADVLGASHKLKQTFKCIKTHYTAEQQQEQSGGEVSEEDLSRQLLSCEQAFGLKKPPHRKRQFNLLADGRRDMSVRLTREYKRAYEVQTRLGVSEELL